ncbi:hypothetical protein SAY86_009991 [Trapa natans]|uniref:C2H2-type domain-containing protein n=1 Tax=Trapa natans TaxID=22666 RepID=A0AAN7L5I4_TRANT|nr:hypothetical protein SAY86_009991 [Trapa natans]
MLENISPLPTCTVNPPPQQLTCTDSGIANNASIANKRKRRPAGTPDPDAEVISLSPKTLLESDRYVCEICNQGFQRDQNLQMHRRRHKVPWKLLKRETAVARKRVFVCPEPSCLHHDPCHALGDLVGIKKHYRRKHSSHKQWVCQKCCKAYAVQSDYKAHLKTCGTRGHSCDCGRVFSRVESFIEHQDRCNMSCLRCETTQALQQACLSRTASSPSPSGDTNFSTVPWPPPTPTCNTSNMTMFRKPREPIFLQSSTAIDSSPKNNVISSTSINNNSGKQYHNLELQLSTASNPIDVSVSIERDDNHSTQLQLSIGSSDIGRNSPRDQRERTAKPAMTASSIKEQAREQLQLAMSEKARAEDARRQARRQMELAEQEFTNAKRIRQQAQGELDRALALKGQATKQVNSTMLQMTCHTCKQQFQGRAAIALPPPPPPPPPPSDENSLILSYNNVSSAGTEGEIEKID